MNYIMQVVFVALATMVLGVGILANNHTKTSDDQLSATGKPLLIEESVLSATSTPTPTPLPDPTTSPAAEVIDYSYLYPNSKIIFNSENKLEIESADSADIVTDWYQEKIKDMGFSAKTAVRTKTNGVVENKLTGSESGEKVEVVITSSGSVTKIVVTTHTD